MTQLSLPLGTDDDADALGFIVGDANSRAVSMLDRWATWPVMAALLVGPRKSGRSMLGRIFVAKSGGTLIDDADRTGEARLFHAWNDAQQSRRPLLMIADVAPPLWSIALPDLRTRITASQQLKIGPADDVLTSALLQRSFDRRLLYARPALFTWLARHVDRSYVALDRIADLLEAEAHDRRNRRVSIPIARSCLARAGLLATDNAGAHGEASE